MKLRDLHTPVRLVPYLFLTPARDHRIFFDQTDDFAIAMQMIVVSMMI